ncbi:MAG: nucleic acid/nucleotide deaminase domain-containing protein [Chlamydiia bacterium]
MVGISFFNFSDENLDPSPNSSPEASSSSFYTPKKGAASILSEESSYVTPVRQYVREKQTPQSGLRSGSAGRPRISTYVSLTETPIQDIYKSLPSRSPHKKKFQLPYGTDILSQLAINYKRQNQISSSRNVALIIFKSKTANSYHYAFSSSGNDELPEQKGVCTTGKHAELKVYDYIPHCLRGSDPDKKIVAIYTERAPCQKSGKNCELRLKAVLPDTWVYYSFPYPELKTERDAQEKALKKAQKAYGIPNKPSSFKGPLSPFFDITVGKLLREFKKLDPDPIDDAEIEAHTEKFFQLGQRKATYLSSKHDHTSPIFTDQAKKARTDAP